MELAIAKIWEDNIVPDEYPKGVFRILENVGEDYIYWMESFSSRESAASYLKKKGFPLVSS